MIYCTYCVCVCAMLLFERASMQMTYQNQHGKNPRRGPPSRCRRCWTKLAMASGLTLETSLEGLQVPATSNTVTGEGSWEQPCWGWCISKSICRTLSMKSNVPHKHVITPEIWMFAIGTAPKKVLSFESAETCEVATRSTETGLQDIQHSDSTTTRVLCMYSNPTKIEKLEWHRLYLPYRTLSILGLLH